MPDRSASVPTIVDAHHHCWGKPPVPDYPAYGLEDFHADVAGAGRDVVATVYVEANSHYRTTGPTHLRPVGETEHIDALASECARRGGSYSGLFAGIVAHADLMLSDGVKEVLEAHLAASPGRFKGIRHRTSFDPDNPLHSNAPGMLQDSRFREGARTLASLGLSLDVMVLHPQLKEVLDLARALAGTSIILNHIGAPMMVGRFAGRGPEVFAEWRADMARLAECDNVLVKIGGLNMDFTGLSFVGEARPSAEALAGRQHAFVLETINLFGPERCMFESNFPVDKLGVDYATVWDAFDLMTRDLSPTERDALFGGTAMRAYRLDGEIGKAASL